MAYLPTGQAARGDGPTSTVSSRMLAAIRTKAPAAAPDDARLRTRTPGEPAPGDSAFYVQPDEPAPRSRLPLYLGIGAAAGFLFLLLRKKKKR